MRRKDEDPKPRIIYSPGKYHFGNPFEQVRDNKYVVQNVETKQFEVFDSNGDYFPLDKVAWPLCQEAVAYGDKETLWRDVKQFIWDHLFLPDDALYDVLTAWVFASWLPEVWSVVPYLFFFGPIASGKTRALEVLQRLAYRAILSSNISSAALFRACEAWRPTVILDETEIYSKTEKADIIGLLNSGYRRGQCAVRAKNTDHGVELEVFDVFGFKALAGTEGLAAALESRSIMVRMIKNRRKVRLFVDEKRAEMLRSKLLMWRLETLQFRGTTKEEWMAHVNQVDEQSELSERRERFLEGVPPLNIESGRTQELFQCLIAMANSGRENIIRYAEKTEEMNALEERASVEAELVGVILNSNLTLHENVVLTAELAEAFNSSRTEREKWKTNSVGRIMRRLGFQKRHTKQGNGWFVDRDRLTYLAQIYRGEAGAPENGSLSSPSSPDHPLSIHQGEQREPGERFPDKPTLQETFGKVRSSLPACFDRSKLVARIVALGFSREESEKRVQRLIDEGLIAQDSVGSWHWVSR